MGSRSSPSVYCKNAKEAAKLLGLPSRSALYRKLEKDQVEGVLHLVDEGQTESGNDRKGRYYFERAKLRLRTTPLPPSTPAEPADDGWKSSQDNPANWDRLRI